MKSEDFVRQTICEISNYPTEVIVSRTTDANGVLLTITTNPLDAGLIIGKDGIHIKAIRILARVIGNKIKEHINVQYQDPQGNFKKNGEQITRTS